jgi:hypothetical protein
LIKVKGDASRVVPATSFQAQRGRSAMNMPITLQTAQRRRIERLIKVNNEAACMIAAMPS